MNTVQSYYEPIPELVGLSNEYSQINTSILYIPTPEDYKQLSSMGTTGFNSFIAKMIRATTPNKSFKEALEFAITTRSLIKSFMDNKGINTVELGKCIGVSDVTVGRWLNGTSNITKNNLNKLASYFNVSTNYLIGIDSRPTQNEEMEQQICIEFTKQQLESFGISNLDKAILKKCGYYLIDPYLNDEYYKEKVELAQVTENQFINDKDWITWVYTISYFNSFPKKLALVKISKLEEMGVDYLNLDNPIEYTEEIKNIAQYVDYDKLKLLLEDRKNLLAFNFEKSLESIK